jgi:acyl carrier protein
VASFDQTLRTVQTVLVPFADAIDGTGPDAVQPDSCLTDYASSSVLMLQIHTRLEDALGMEITASALLDHDTVGALANYLAGCR